MLPITITSFVHHYFSARHTFFLSLFLSLTCSLSFYLSSKIEPNITILPSNTTFHMDKSPWPLCHRGRVVSKIATPPCCLSNSLRLQPAINISLSLCMPSFILSCPCCLIDTNFFFTCRTWRWRHLGVRYAKVLFGSLKGLNCVMLGEGLSRQGGGKPVKPLQ